MKNGVPWDEAWSMEPVEALAAAVVFGEMEGNRFDWQSMTWKDRNA